MMRNRASSVISTIVEIISITLRTTSRTTSNASVMVSLNDPSTSLTRRTTLVKFSNAIKTAPESSLEIADPTILVTSIKSEVILNNMAESPDTIADNDFKVAVVCSSEPATDLTNSTTADVTASTVSAVVPTTSVVALIVPFAFSSMVVTGVKEVTKDSFKVSPMLANPLSPLLTLKEDVLVEAKEDILSDVEDELSTKVDVELLAEDDNDLVGDPTTSPVKVVSTAVPFAFSSIVLTGVREVPKDSFKVSPLLANPLSPLLTLKEEEVDAKEDILSDTEDKLSTKVVVELLAEDDDKLLGDSTTSPVKAVSMAVRLAFSSMILTGVEEIPKVSFKISPLLANPLSPLLTLEDDVLVDAKEDILSDAEDELSTKVDVELLAEDNDDLVGDPIASRIEIVPTTAPFAVSTFVLAELPKVAFKMSSILSNPLISLLTFDRVEVFFGEESLAEDEVELLTKVDIELVAKAEDERVIETDDEVAVEDLLGALKTICAILLEVAPFGICKEATINTLK